jgi:hypothetical protein
MDPTEEEEFVDWMPTETEKRAEVLEKELESAKEKNAEILAQCQQAAVDQLSADQQQALTSQLQQQLDRFQQAAEAATADAAQQQQQHQQQQLQVQQQPQLQLQQQQQAAAAAAEAAAAATAAAASAQAAEARANSDWLADFPAEESQLPKLPAAQPDEQQTAFVLRLLTLKQAAKFASLPRMTFQQLLVAPWFVHRLVGDTIWNACWTERAPRVTDEMTVPQKLLNIVTHVVTTLEGEYNEKTTDEQRAAATRTITEGQEEQRKRARLAHVQAQPLPS